jgi:transcriptional regulator with XRE-family HTH domain
MDRGSRRAGQSLEVYSIGPKLRALRTQKCLTLSRLAAETGLSTALLSKLETDHMIPILSTLASLCRVFGVGLGFFFADAEMHSLSITRKLHETRRGRKHKMLKQFPLNARSESPLLAREIEFPPGVVRVLTEVGKAFIGVIYVLEGRLELDSAGQRDLLEGGDCVCLRTEMLITWGAYGASRCRALVVTSGQTAGDVPIL